MKHYQESVQSPSNAKLLAPDLNSRIKYFDKIKMFGTPSMYKFMFQKDITTLLQNCNINLSPNSTQDVISKKYKRYRMRK